jgi:hypothetical protein
LATAGAWICVYLIFCWRTFYCTALATAKKRLTPLTPRKAHIQAKLAKFAPKTSKLTHVLANFVGFGLVFARISLEFQEGERGALQCSTEDLTPNKNVYIFIEDDEAVVHVRVRVESERKRETPRDPQTSSIGNPPTNHINDRILT